MLTGLQCWTYTLTNVVNSVAQEKRGLDKGMISLCCIIEHNLLGSTFVVLMVLSVHAKEPWQLHASVSGRSLFPAEPCTHFSWISFINSISSNCMYTYMYTHKSTYWSCRLLCATTTIFNFLSEPFIGQLSPHDSLSSQSQSSKIRWPISNIIVSD